MKAIQAEYPLSQIVRDNIKKFQHFLELSDEDVICIEQPIIDQAKTNYDENLKQQSAKCLERKEVERPDQATTEEMLIQTDDLSSSRGVDYTTLRDLLRAGRWREADVETSIVMLVASRRLSEGSIRVEDIIQFPCTDLRTIDQLWVKYSNGRFGFSVQQKIWDEVNEDYGIFGDRVGWRVEKLQTEWLSYDSNTFSLSAPEGHLPIVLKTPGWVDNLSRSVSGSWMFKGFEVGARRNSMATVFEVWASIFSRLKVCKQ